MLACGLVEEVSRSTIWRWLDQDALRPWRHRPWIFPRDPDFTAKAGVVLDLYQGRYQHTARPFAWRFTRTDLQRLLERLQHP